MLTAHRKDLPVFDGTQQLGLKGKIDLANFIEDQGAVLGTNKVALPSAGRAGISPFHMAEELRFEQFRGNRGAVDDLAGPGPVPAVSMNVACQHILAGAGLPGYQHRILMGGNFLRLRQDAAQFPAPGYYNRRCLRGTKIGKQFQRKTGNPPANPPGQFRAAIFPIPFDQGHRQGLRMRMLSGKGQQNVQTSRHQAFQPPEQLSSVHPPGPEGRDHNRKGMTFERLDQLQGTIEHPEAEDAR